MISQYIKSAMAAEGLTKEELTQLKKQQL